MQFVNDAVLLILGSGDVIGKLHEMVSGLKLQEKVIFKIENAICSNDAAY